MKYFIWNEEVFMNKWNAITGLIKDKDFEGFRIFYMTNIYTFERQR